ncbi:MAG TPA: hypothetical protein VFS15_00760, partial [Kofleriaceae bacterium]|nr:hypothetical protein [Kofleriaceae bacterium]
MRLALAVAAIGVLAGCKGSRNGFLDDHGAASAAPAPMVAAAAPASPAKAMVEGGSQLRPHHEDRVVECP